jgi:HEAT repeat protein
MACIKRIFLAAVLAVSMFPAADSEESPSANRQQPGVSKPAVAGNEPAQLTPPGGKKGLVTGTASPQPGSPEAAWILLTQAATSDKFRDRSDALSALTILDHDRRAIALIENGLNDKEEAIRMLSASSLGDLKARSSIPKLWAAMNDPSAEVIFAAAQALWRMGDRSGRDIFYDVLDGERQVTPGPLKSKLKQARMDMHDPKALALIGVNEASGALLGPFSMGVSLAEAYAKGSGGSVQALCAQLLASDDNRRTLEELTDALADKNWAVRVAAARSLAKLNDRAALPRLKDLMASDKSQPARLTTAAAIIRLNLPRALSRSTPANEAARVLSTAAETTK